MAAPDLNVAQLRAVEHSGGPLLVLAGPGTGKTGVLVSRIAHLVGERGVDPKRILALTFSRRAAEEMKERVRRRVPETVFIDARTFHSFALYVVRRQAAALGFSRAPEILPTAEQWALVSELLASEDPHEWGLSAGAFESPATVREVYDLLLRAQEHLLEPAQMRDLGEKSRLPHLVRAADLLQRYRKRLGELAEVDYEGVIQHAITLLIENGPARDILTDTYDHVLVDEFQDTNRSQLELLRLLMPGENPSVFCVGDDAQSIYGFRGARVQNVREFEDSFPGAQTVQLTTNYRSAERIIRLAEDAIAGDESRPPREEQRAASMQTGAVLYEVSGSSREEGEWIADRIAELNRAQGVPLEEIAILRRSLLDAVPLVDALASRGIHLDVAAATKGSSAQHLALLLAAANGDEPAFVPASRALTSPMVGLLPSSARMLRATAEASGRSVFGLIRSGDAPIGVPEEEMDRARRVVAAVDGAALEEDFLQTVNALWKGLPGTRELVGELQAKLASMGVPRQNPFFGSTRTVLVPTEQARIRETLSAAGRSTRDLRKSATDLASALKLSAPETRKDAGVLCRAARRATDAPRLEGVRLRSGEWQSRRDDLRSLITTGEAYSGLRAQYDEVLIPEAWDQDLLETRQHLANYGDRWWRPVSGDYRKARNRLGGLTRENPPKDVSEQLTLVDSVLEARRSGRMQFNLYSEQWYDP